MIFVTFAELWWPSWKVMFPQNVDYASFVLVTYFQLGYLCPDKICSTSLNTTSLFVRSWPNSNIFLVVPRLFWTWKYISTQKFLYHKIILTQIYFQISIFSFSKQSCFSVQKCRKSNSAACKDRLPPKVIFQRRLSSTESYSPLKVVFHRRLSATKGCLSPKGVFHLP